MNNEQIEAFVSLLLNEYQYQQIIVLLNGLSGNDLYVNLDQLNKRIEQEYPQFDHVDCLFVTSLLWSKLNGLWIIQYWVDGILDHMDGIYPHLYNAIQNSEIRPGFSIDEYTVYIKMEMKHE